MMTFFSPFVAAALLAQAPAAGGLTGEVVDHQGKPVADARVVLYAPPTVYGQGDSAEVETKADSEGKFSLSFPPLKRILINGVNFLAYRPDLAITAHPFISRPRRLVLEKPAPRTVLMEGSDGKPMAGARIVPRVLSIFGKGPAEVPSSLAQPLAATTGPDGKATLDYLAVRDRLMSVRITADAIGTQDIVLMSRSSGGSESGVISIKLKPVSHLSGRIVDEGGRPVAGQVVEVWSRGDDAWSGPNIVEFKSGPLRSGADGSFQTPDNLLAGSAYRVAIHKEGSDPITSDWLTIADQPRDLSVFALRPSRTVRGQVVDRQGKPVAGIEVFQSGDGPKRTSTKTDAEGRFSLGGFRQGPVFVFVHGELFRFQGRLVKPDETNVTVELTRVSERPRREMKMLPDPIPFEESKRLAKRLAEPLWTTAVDNGRYAVLSRLVNVDPARVLERMESVKFDNPGAKDRLREELVLALARTDFEEASAVAESIGNPATRASALMDLADTLPARDRDRKLALLDRALLQRAPRPTRAIVFYSSAKLPNGGTTWARSTRPGASVPKASS